MSKRIIIISGGELNEEFVLSILEKEENQYVIGVDRGMEFLCRHQILPNYIVGDFDSVKKEIGDYYRNETNVPIREFNPVKDASDTEIAIRLAMTLGAKEILILGATGGRIDHLWANVQSLAIPFKAGIDAVIMDTQNKIRLIGGGETHLKKGETYGPYFSVFPLGEEVYGFTPGFPPPCGIQSLPTPIHPLEREILPNQNNYSSTSWKPLVSTLDPHHLLLLKKLSRTFSRYSHSLAL